MSSSDPNALEDMSGFLEKTNKMLEKRAIKRQATAGDEPHGHARSAPNIAVLERSDTLKRMTQLLHEKSSKRDEARKGRRTEPEGGLQRNQEHRFSQYDSDCDDTPALKGKVRRSTMVEDTTPISSDVNDYRHDLMQRQREQIMEGNLKGSSPTFPSAPPPVRPSPPQPLTPTSLDLDGMPKFLDLDVPQIEDKTPAPLREIRLLAYAIRCELRGENLNFDDYTASWGHVDWEEAFFKSEIPFFQNLNHLLWWKILLAFGMYAIFGVSIGNYVYRDILEYWPIYLTHWAVVLQTLYHTLSLIMTFRYVRNKKRCRNLADRPMPRTLRWTWFIWSLSLPLSFLVSVLWWSVVWTGNVYIPVASFLTHGVSFFLIFFDSTVVCPPFLLLHGIYVALLGVLYLLWTIIFYITGLRDPYGHRYIYAQVDWSEPSVTSKLTFFLSIIFLPVVLTTAWWLSYLRKRIMETRKMTKKLSFQVQDNGSMV